MQLVVHFSWWFVSVAFVTIAPSIDTQKDRTNQRKRHVLEWLGPETSAVTAAGSGRLED